MKIGLKFIRFELLLCLSFVFLANAYAETDITDKIQLTKSRLYYDRLAKTSYLDVSITNVSTDILITPIEVIIDSISTPDVTVANADGTTDDGKQYFEYYRIAPNEISSSKKWSFNNPNRLRFSYSISVVGTVEETYVDCNGDTDGAASIDNCGECVGGNTGKTACSQDCNGDWGGTASVDNCNVCVGGNTGKIACNQDCNGDWGGIAFIDNCGECVGGNTGKTECVQDCNGILGGTAYIDNCNECVGGNTGKTSSDEDNDGVLDCNDECLNTPIGFSVDLNGCPEMKTGSSTGDPHFFTYDGLVYHDQLIGEFILSREMIEDGVEIQARQARISGWSPCVTLNTAVAIRMANNIIEYRASSNEILVDGLIITLSENETHTTGNGVVIRRNKGITCEQDLSNIRVSAIDRGQYINIYVSANGYLQGLLAGLFGNFDGNSNNDLMLRDGSTADTIMELMNDWRISDSESLFTYDSGQNTSTFTAVQTCGIHLTNEDISYAGQLYVNLFGEGTCDDGMVISMATDLAAGMPEEDVAAWVTTLKGYVAPSGTLWYIDSDGDGYGSDSNFQQSCYQPTGYVNNSLDCDDNDTSVNPGAIEICGDDIDNDCDGLVDEDCGDTYEILVDNYVSGTLDYKIMSQKYSPYYVKGDILVTALKIESGVEVIFLGDYAFEVSGKLEAIGNEQDQIIFTKADTNEQGWKGIFFNQSFPDTELTYCKVEKSHDSGIKIYNSSPIIQHCTISNNSALNGSGLNISGPLSVTLINCNVRENGFQGHNPRGGGIYATAPLSIVGGEIINNSIIDIQSSCWNGVSASTLGGGIYSTAGLELKNVQVIGNVASSTGGQENSRGGGIYSTGSFSAYNCIVAQNSAGAGGCNMGDGARGYGGGIYIGSSVSIKNCIVTQNTTRDSNGYGGGIFAESDAQGTIENCTVAFSNNPGGIYAYSGITLINSIVYFNSSYQVAGSIQTSYCDIEGGGGAGNISVDPQLVLNPDDPGALAIPGNSLCIDAGNPNPQYNDGCSPPSYGTSINDIGAHGGPGGCNW